MKAYQHPDLSAARVGLCRVKAMVSIYQLRKGMDLKTVGRVVGDPDLSVADPPIGTNVASSRRPTI